MNSHKSDEGDFGAINGEDEGQGVKARSLSSRGQVRVQLTRLWGLHYTPLPMGKKLSLSPVSPEGLFFIVPYKHSNFCSIG